MDFTGYSLGTSVQTQLSSMEQSRRVPHAILVTGGDAQKRMELCEFLSMWAVCTEGTKPCRECPQCQKVKGKNHIDIYFAKGQGKTNVISVEEIREITKDLAVAPNEAQKKIYVLEDADKRMGIEALNAFLKTLEEPVQDTLFLLTAENVNALPETILSRCTTLSIETALSVDENTKKLANDIVMGIVDVSEISLLYATGALKSRQKALSVLPIVRLILCDVLSRSVGAEGVFDDELAVTLCRKLTKNKIIMLIDVTSEAINKINRNVNLALVLTWLCGEYRRIICVM